MFQTTNQLLSQVMLQHSGCLSMLMLETCEFHSASQPIPQEVPLPAENIENLLDIAIESISQMRTMVLVDLHDTS